MKYKGMAQQLIKAGNAKKLSRLAAAQRRPAADFANEAVERYLEHQAWMDERTRQVIERIDSGEERMIPHDAVVRSKICGRKARRA